MGKLDELGGAVRKLIGDLADDRDVYYKFATLESPGDTYLGREMMEGMPGRIPPPAGSESGMINPYQLILKTVYPPDLAEAAARRTGSDIQAPFDGAKIPLLVRPSRTVSDSGDHGVHLARYVDGSRELHAIDVAGESSDPLRTLIHEARHATEHPHRDSLKSLTSISSQRPRADGFQLSDTSRRYFSRPSEVLAYLGEAGDDFVKERGRLVGNVRDANAVMERVEVGDSLQRLHPLVRQLYVSAYKNNPTARSHINNILTRYFAVPGAIGTGAAAMGGGTQDDSVR